MGTARRWKLMAAAILVAYAVPFGAVAALPFEGTLTPEAPVRLSGSFEAVQTSTLDGLGSWLPDASASSGAWSLKGRFLLTITELAWGRGDVDAAANAYGRAVTYSVDARQKEILDPSISRLSTSTEGSWVLALAVPGSMRLGSGSTCLLSATKAGRVNLTSLEQVPFPTLSWGSEGGAPVVSAQCETGPLVATGPAQLAVFGSRFTLGFREPGAARPTTLDLEAGRGPASGATVNQRAVWVSITGLETTNKWVLPGGSLRLRAAQATVHGLLQIPPSGGSVTWGNDSLSGDARPLAPEGRFDVRPAGANAIVFDGEVAKPWTELAVGAGALTVVLVLARKGLLLAQAFFTRLTRETSLDHPRREAILAVAEANPGIRLEGVAKTLGLSRRSVEYHADVLRRQGLLVCRRFGKATAVYAPGRVSREQARLLHHTRHPSVQEVLRLVREHGPVTQAELVRRSRLSQARMSRILGDLSKVGILASRVEGRRRLYQDAHDGPVA